MLIQKQTKIVLLSIFQEYLIFNVHHSNFKAEIEEETLPKPMVGFNRIPCSTWSIYQKHVLFCLQIVIWVGHANITLILDF